MGGWEGEGMGQTDLRGSCSEAALESEVTVVGQGEAGWGWALPTSPGLSPQPSGLELCTGSRSQSLWGRFLPA